MEPLWLTAGLALSILMVKNLLAVSRETIETGFSIVRLPWLLWLFIGVSLVYFVFLLLHALLPETFYDSLNYFLGMPHFWLLQHGITDYPTHLLSGYFHGGSLFYLFAYVLGGTEGAKVLSAFVLGFNALFAFGWMKEKAGTTAAWVAVCAIVTFPLIYLNSWAVRVDGLSTFTTLLFFYCVKKACEGNRPQRQNTWILAAALMAGLALSIKPTAIVGILAAFVAVLWQAGPALFKRVFLWATFAGFAFFETGPWLLKNAVFTGNPFFPYAISWMGGRSFPAAGYARLLGENRQFLPMDQGFLSVLTLPWRLTMPQAGDGQWIGPLFLAFLPALFFLEKKNDSTKFFAKVAVLSFVIGLYLSHMLRFTLPAFVLSLILLSTVFFSQKEKGWKIFWMVSVLACAVLFFGNYLDLSATHYGGSGIWRGLETREDYLRRELLNSYEPLAAWTAENLPDDAKLLIVGDSRGVYYERPYLAQSVFDEPVFAHAARSARDPEGILKQLRQLGITHVVVNGPEGLRVSKEYHQYELTPEEWKKLDDYFRSGLKAVYWKNFQGVYEVEPRLEAKTKNEFDPLSAFAPEAHDYFQDFQDGNYKESGKALAQLTSLFPQDPYWRSQRGILLKAERQGAPAFKN